MEQIRQEFLAMESLLNDMVNFGYITQKTAQTRREVLRDGFLAAIDSRSYVISTEQSERANRLSAPLKTQNKKCVVNIGFDSDYNSDYDPNGFIDY